MTDADFTQMEAALRAAAKRFPHCRIAACECHSRLGQWRAGCKCLCHFFDMDRMHGADNWTLEQFIAQAPRGNMVPDTTTT